MTILKFLFPGTAIFSTLFSARRRPRANRPLGFFQKNIQKTSLLLLLRITWATLTGVVPKYSRPVSGLILLLLLLSGQSAAGAGFTIGHRNTNLSAIPPQWIAKAKSDLHIVYNHTSHGSQLITGMDALMAYPDFGNTYAWSDTSQGNSGSLSLDDSGIPGISDLSQGDVVTAPNGIAQWAQDTFDFLVNPENYHVNIVMWSWCSIDGHNIDLYLRSMEWLIARFGPGGSHARASRHPVQFVFMTGHAEGGGEGDGSDARNRLIRQHCQVHGRILFDFADMENYDPDNNYFLDKLVQDDLDYDSNTDGMEDANWASEYLVRHPGGELFRLTKGTGSFPGCSSCAHSDGPDNDARLNCVLKGRAAWTLFARLAGWNPGGNNTSNEPGKPLVGIQALLLAE